MKEIAFGFCLGVATVLVSGFLLRQWRRRQFDKFCKALQQIYEKHSV